MSLAALALSLSFTGSLAGFEVLRYRWDQKRAPYRINPNFPDRTLSGTKEQQIEILRCAGDVWTHQSRAEFEFIYEGTTTVGRLDTLDHVNSVSWADEDGDDALAIMMIDGFSNRASQFDIVFFDKTLATKNRWIGPRDPEPDDIDITGVGVHEFGHALGLGHTPVEGATMFPFADGNDVAARTLHQDDRTGVEFLYGIRSGAPPVEPVIETIEPAIGPARGGNEVVILGRNFTWKADSDLRFGDKTILPASWEIESCGRLRISSLPNGPLGTVDLRLENSLGVAIVPEAYRYGSGPLALSGIEPSLGPVRGGIPVTVKGENFTEQTTVNLGQLRLENTTLIDPRTIAGELPASVSPRTVNVWARHGKERVEMVDAFTYTAKELAVAETFGVPGQTGLGVDITASTDEPLVALSFPVTYDPTKMRVEDITTRRTSAEEAEFVTVTIDEEAGSAILELVMGEGPGGPVIPADAKLRVAVLRASIFPDTEVGIEVPLRIPESAGTPPVALSFLAAGATEEARPFALDGKVTIIDEIPFLRGDADGNGFVQITDPIFLLTSMFLGGKPPPCDDAADANDDGALNMTDAVFTLLFLFRGGEEPPPPFPSLGVDPTEDDLGCE